MNEKAKTWCFRAFKRHHQIVRRHARKEKVSQSEVIRRALEEYETNHGSEHSK